MRVRVTCEICGHRMRLERTEFIPGQYVPLVCHNCETPIALTFCVAMVIGFYYRTHETH
jgi:hypothetical protein